MKDFILGIIITYILMFCIHCIGIFMFFYWNVCRPDTKFVYSNFQEYSGFKYSKKLACWLEEEAK